MPEVVFNALLLADRVFAEDNGKKGILGIFHKLNFPSLPAIAPPWFVYASFENVIGQNDFTVNIARKESQELVFSAGGQIDMQDPTQGVEIAIPIPPIKFMRSGKYLLVLQLNGKDIASRVFDVAIVGETTQ